MLATINGQMRPVNVRDRNVASEVAAAEKADTAQPGHVAAPFQGVVTVVVEKGDQVEAGDTVATIEAMKMEASITAPISGTVERIALSGTQAVDGGDLVLVLAWRRVSRYVPACPEDRRAVCTGVIAAERIRLTARRSASPGGVAVRYVGRPGGVAAGRQVEHLVAVLDPAAAREHDQLLDDAG